MTGAEERVRLQAKRDTLSRELAEAEQALEHGEAVQGGLRAELEAALRRAEQAGAEPWARSLSDSSAPQT